MILLLLLPVKLQRIMKNFAASMLRLQELKSIFIYLFQETLIAVVVRFTDSLLTILMMAKTYTIHAVKQKKGGGSPQCHLIKTLADRPPLFSLANKNIKRPSFRAHQRLFKTSLSIWFICQKKIESPNLDSPFLMTKPFTLQTRRTTVSLFMSYFTIFFSSSKYSL